MTDHNHLPHDHDAGARSVMEHMPAAGDIRTVAGLMKQLGDPTRCLGRRGNTEDGSQCSQCSLF